MINFWQMFMDSVHATILRLPLQVRFPSLASCHWCLKLYGLVVGGMGIIFSLIWVILLLRSFYFSCSSSLSSYTFPFSFHSHPSPLSPPSSPPPTPQVIMHTYVLAQIDDDSDLKVQR